METKSYTLADGTTATVTADDNGVPFNEGMNVLSKAIKAKIDSSITLTADSSNYTGGECTSSTIKGGIRLTFGESGYIDVTH